MSTRAGKGDVPARIRPRVGVEAARTVPPSLPLPLLARPRLLERMRAADRHRLTLVHADAGYGKTTLLVQYADQNFTPILAAGGDAPGGAWSSQATLRTPLSMNQRGDAVFCADCCRDERLPS